MPSSWNPGTKNRTLGKGHLYQQNFSDQLIKERTGHRSLEALHKYKRTGSNQQMQVSMALLPSIAKKSDFAKVEKENIPQPCMNKEKDAFCGPDDDDFVPMRKKKFDPEENINRCDVFFLLLEASAREVLQY